MRLVWFTASLFAINILHVGSTSEIPPESFDGDCEAYRSLLTRVLVQFSATYFADNPRSEGSMIDPNQISPLTPIQLFREFYGESAAPDKFKKVLLKMYYSNPGPDGPSPEDADRIVLRNSIYTYAKASSYELAREKFGILLYQGITDQAVNSPSWLNLRCLETEFIANAKAVINTELERLRNELGEFQFATFLDLGAGTTLAFAIDDTASMSGEIHATKIRAKQIVDERQGSLDVPSDFVLVPFNDPTYGPVTVTNNPDTFKAAIDRLYAHSRGNTHWAELSMRGILLAIENSREGSTIFVITDADAKDVELQHQVVVLAKQKNVKIVFLLTNRVTTTICGTHSYGYGHGNLEAIRCNTPSFRYGYELYEYIAQSTGGNILVVSKRDIFQATQVIDSSVKQGVVDIARHFLSASFNQFNVSIDSSIQEVFFQLTGDCGNNISLTFRRIRIPIINTVVVDDLLEGSVMVDGRFGEWTILVDVAAKCSAKVIGRSTFGFVQTLAKKSKNSVGAVTLKRFEGQALSTDNIVILVDMYGKQPGDRVTSIDIASQTTTRFMKSFSIDDAETNEFRVSLSANPNFPVFVIVRGVDSNGFKFTRTHTSPIEFVDFPINCVDIENIVFRPGDTVNITLSVTNLGSHVGLFELGATDTQGYVTPAGVTPKRIAVNGRADAASQLRLTAPKDAVVGTTSFITVTATSNLTTSLLYHTCRIVVGQRLRPTVESFLVNTVISSRFAETTLTSIVYNNAAVGREAAFHVILPIDAFITNFSMTIDNVTYPGSIREKEEAKRIFTAAKERGFSAGHVAARDSSTTVFETSVNLEPFKRVTFELKYQELLTKKQDKYTYGVSVQMLQPVQQFRIEVKLCESDELLFVSVPGFQSDQTSIPYPVPLRGVEINQQSNTAQITYSPNADQQTIFSPLGLNGKFIVEYDVVRDSSLSDLIVTGSHFVHFLSPDLEPMPKRVVFALDVSGSMFGHKLEQLQLAMNDIIDELRPNDQFSIIVFNSSLSRWEPDGSTTTLVSATASYKEQAKNFLANVLARGGTDVLQAALAAIDMLEAAIEESTSESPLGGIDESNPAADYIILLTDGRSTEGVIDSKEITKSIQDRNSERYAIHTISFGALADAKTLGRIAAQNLGTTIQLFLDIDTRIQMVNFFSTIARPILRDVILEYPKDKVKRTSDFDFPTTFSQIEIIVAGEFRPEFVLNNSLQNSARPRRDVTFDTLPVVLRGKTRKEARIISEDAIPQDLTDHCVTSDFQIINFVERLNIFMLLKSLLRDIDATNNSTEEETLREEALEFSLEYGFVTPGITSLLVLKPGDLQTLEKTEEDAADDIALSTTSRPIPTTGRIIPSRGGIPTSPPASRRFSVFGDPHIIINLGNHINICFNWHGKKNKVYNILYDDIARVSVNARMIQATSRDGKISKTYLGEIGFTFGKRNVTAKVDVTAVTIVVGFNSPLRLPLNEKAVIKKRGIEFHTIPISDHLAIVFIVVSPRIQFKILSRIHSNNINIKDHLDLALIRGDGLSQHTIGILGQFPLNLKDDESKGSIGLTLVPDTDEAMLSHRHNMARVRHHSMYDSYSHKEVGCWYLENLNELTGEDMEEHVMRHLFDNPTVSLPK